MMLARDFRQKARQALSGKWGVAVAVGFVGSLLSSIYVANSGAASHGQGEGFFSGYLSIIDQRFWITFSTVLVVFNLLVIVIGGAIRMGWCGFNLNLLRGKDVRFSQLFDYFHQLWRGFCMMFLTGLFTFLWSLLFIIPGIIAAYRYAMVPYLMAEFPDLDALDALRESKRLMSGNKWRLFCLQLSFLGWIMLSALTFGIGMLWVTPYTAAAEAAFYLEITGRMPEGNAETTSGWRDPGVF